MVDHVPIAFCLWRTLSNDWVYTLVMRLSEMQLVYERLNEEFQRTSAVLVPVWTIRTHSLGSISEIGSSDLPANHKSIIRIDVSTFAVQRTSAIPSSILDYSSLLAYSKQQNSIFSRRRCIQQIRSIAGSDLLMFACQSVNVNAVV
jgi:hypothetical protein